MSTFDYAPTDREEWEEFGRTTATVVTRPAYALVTVLAATASLTLFVASQNLNLFLTVVVFGETAVPARLSFLLDLYPFVGPQYGATRGGLLVLTSGLVGANVALAAYRVRTLSLVAREGWFGAGGVLFGALGAGCAACGSAAVAALLSTVGVTVSLTALPLDGIEFLLLGIVGLSISLYTLTQPVACRR